MRLYFFCPDDPRPSGGVRHIYRQVDILCQAGYEAYVVHGMVPFRCNWFSHTTPVKYQVELRIADDDWVILPEPMANTPIDVPNLVILNQNTYNLYSSLRGYHSYDRAKAMICTSERDYQTCREVFGDKWQIERVFYGIDEQRCYRAARARKKVIACMPRKLPHHERFLANSLLQSGLFAGWEWVSIDRMAEEEVAGILRDASIFISLSHDESFGLPPLEAALCGCRVIGYDGCGGREYFEQFPGNFTRVPQNDLLALLQELKKAIVDGSWSLEPPAMAGRHDYTLEQEKSSVLLAWERILEWQK